MNEPLHGPNSSSGPKRVESERLAELLLERALFGLAEEQQRDLDAAYEAAEFDERAFDASEYELAAASVALALSVDASEALPASLRDKVMAGAKAFQALEASASLKLAKPRAPSAASSAVASHSPVRVASRAAPRVDAGAGPRSTSRLPWFVAAAAAVLALLGWWPTAGPRVPTSVEARAELLARPDTLRIDAKGQEAFAPGASGDIVWSNTAQSGFIRLVGAPANDAKVQQYQLWIFDAEQQNPIDGGVFDVPANGEVLVPIDAKLRVAKPTLFAITLEKPGGVVVSDRERIAIVAAL